MKQSILIKALFASALLVPAALQAGQLPPPPREPVRFAKMTVQALKTFKQQRTDGTYETKFEKICTVSGKAPVYDLGTGQGPLVNFPNTALNCETKLKMGPSRLIMTGVASLLKNVDLLGDQKRSDYKNFGATVWIQSKDGSVVKVLPYTYVMSGNLQEKTLVLQVSGENLSADQSHDQVLEERIQVIFKLEDQ